jgi:ABC-type protease/lipase transport system fused ATPase/permease subunit
MELPAPTGRLVVEKLLATPPGAQRPVLAEVGFSIEPGQSLAIVGPSASGKSSLAKLLVGVWKPTEGSVRLDGVEISAWNHDELGPRIGYVPQDIEFYEGSVAENIARLNDVDPDKVVAAARLAGMHDAILTWPKGYDTPLGDAGFALSGGQRQRLAIARALYGDPAYVVFDEPNANLDEVGEQALIATLRHLRERGVTVVLTTHRPRVIGIVDRMLVLKNGRQVGFGPPKDLFAAVQRPLAVPGAAPAAALAPAGPGPAGSTGNATAAAPKGAAA